MLAETDELQEFDVIVSRLHALINKLRNNARRRNSGSARRVSAFRESRDVTCNRPGGGVSPSARNPFRRGFRRSRFPSRPARGDALGPFGPNKIVGRTRRARGIKALRRRGIMARLCLFYTYEMAESRRDYFVCPEQPPSPPSSPTVPERDCRYAGCDEIAPIREHPSASYKAAPFFPRSFVKRR